MREEREQKRETGQVLQASLLMEGPQFILSKKTTLVPSGKLVDDLLRAGTFLGADSKHETQKRVDAALDAALQRKDLNNRVDCFLRHAIARKLDGSVVKVAIVGAHVFGEFPNGALDHGEVSSRIVGGKQNVASHHFKQSASYRPYVYLFVPLATEDDFRCSELSCLDTLVAKLFARIGSA